MLLCIYLQGYVASNSIVQQPSVIQNHETLNCQPGVILPPAPYVQPHQQLIQQLPCGQVVQRPLCVGGGGALQTILAAQQPCPPMPNSGCIPSPCFSNTQLC